LTIARDWPTVKISQYRWDWSNVDVVSTSTLTLFGPAFATFGVPLRADGSSLILSYGAARAPLDGDQRADRRRLGCGLFQSVEKYLVRYRLQESLVKELYWPGSILLGRLLKQAEQYGEVHYGSVKGK